MRKLLFALAFKTVLMVLLSPALFSLGGCEALAGEMAKLSGLREASETGGDQNSGTPSAGKFLAATWNMQALFDGVDEGIEYDEYRESSGWTGEKYQARLNSVAQAIKEMAGPGQKSPDFIALQEVENSQILEDLAQGPLSRQGYGYSFFARNPGSSLGIGVLSRFPFLSTRAHSITSHSETPPRPVLELHLEPQGSPLIVFVCHWKSKLGGDEVTESQRRSQARIILRRLDEIRQEMKDIPVVIMGDLNENHDEFYRQAGAYIPALVPDDLKASELAGFADPPKPAEETDPAEPEQTEQPDPEQTEQPDPEQTEQPEPEQTELPESEQTDPAEPMGSVGSPLFQSEFPAAIRADFIILSNEKPPRSRFFPSRTALYSPWGRELIDGSYFYKNAWETIDHFLLNESFFDESGWDFESCRVVNQNPFTNAGGHPNAYIPGNGLGLSDHLPLLLMLSLKQDLEP